VKLICAEFVVIAEVEIPVIGDVLEIITFCVLFEAAAIEQLKLKLKKALKEYSIKQLWLGGGVVASARLRSELKKVAKEFNVKTLYPYTQKLTGDNAAMIGITGYYKFLKNEFSDLDIIPLTRMSL
jgi:N6-L-threonylcarbamoyladenine synthase